MADFISHYQWMLDKLHDTLPSHLVSHIQSIKISPEENDRHIWLANPSGSFTSKSAWETFKKSRGTSLTLSKIWHCKLPFKVSFHVLRLLNGKLVTDDSLTRFNVHGPSRCYCCAICNIETTNHLFYEGNVAIKVWKYFEDVCGLSTCSTRGIRDKFIKWWLIKQKKVHEMIL